MVESISKLREIVQPTKTAKGRAGEQWIGPMVFRRFSIYSTWLLLHTPISANQVSLLASASMLGAAVLFAQGTYLTALAGAFLVFLYDVLDHSDGEVARYRKTSGPKGEKVELVTGHFEVPWYMAGIALGVFRATSNSWFLVAGFVTIILITKMKLVREVQKEYQTKKFDSNPADTIKKVGASPARLLVFVSFSKYLAELIIIVSAIAGVLPWMLLGYGILTPIGYIVAGYQVVNEPAQLPTIPPK